MFGGARTVTVSRIRQLACSRFPRTTIPPLAILVVAGLVTTGCGGGNQTPPAAANSAGHSVPKGSASGQHMPGSRADEKVGFDGFHAWTDGVWTGVYQNKHMATITVAYNKNFGQAPWPGDIEVQVKSDKLYPGEDWITLRALKEVVWTTHDELHKFWVNSDTIGRANYLQPAATYQYRLKVSYGVGRNPYTYYGGDATFYIAP